MTIDIVPEYSPRQIKHVALSYIPLARMPLVLHAKPCPATPITELHPTNMKAPRSTLVRSLLQQKILRADNNTRSSLSNAPSYFRTHCPHLHAGPAASPHALPALTHGRRPDSSAYYHSTRINRSVFTPKRSLILTRLSRKKMKMLPTNTRTCLLPSSRKRLGKLVACMSFEILASHRLPATSMRVERRALLESCW